MGWKSVEQQVEKLNWKGGAPREGIVLARNGDKRIVICIARKYRAKGQVFTNPACMIAIDGREMKVLVAGGKFGQTRWEKWLKEIGIFLGATPPATYSRESTWVYEAVRAA